MVLVLSLWLSSTVHTLPYSPLIFSSSRFLVSTRLSTVGSRAFFSRLRSLRMEWPPLSSPSETPSGFLKTFLFPKPAVFRSMMLSSSISGLGKIQRDGRKFLDRFKSYFGSQISSQSLNESHICRLQPKSATKVDFFHIFLSSIVSSSRRKLPFDVWPSFPVTTWTLP